MFDLACEPIELPRVLPWYATAAGQAVVTVAAAVAIATLVGVGNVAGQVAQKDWPEWRKRCVGCTGEPPQFPDTRGILLNPRPTYPASPTLEKITSQPSIIVVPLNRPDATELNLPSKIKLPPPEKTVLRYEPGGWLNNHVERFRSIAQKGGEVEIRGLCQSACTLILGHIPRERLCFSEDSRLNFHLASNADGTPSMEHTKWMFGWYPADIKAWLMARGGPEKMPHQTFSLPPSEQFWTLPASELFKMGYRRCE